VKGSEELHAMAVHIRRRRFILGLSSNRLAEAAGVSHAALSHIQQEITAPSKRTLARIAKALGLTLEELYSTAPPSPRELAETCSFTIKRITNTSGITGVSKERPRGKWRAVITLKQGSRYKKYSLGSYDTKEEAKKAYTRARVKMRSKQIKRYFDIETDEPKSKKPGKKKAKTLKGMHYL
jgi:DNA-binding XRE family transcriptional regulator